MINNFILLIHSGGKEVLLSPFRTLGTDTASG